MCYGTGMLDFYLLFFIFYLKTIAKYNPLIQALRKTGWQVNPLITITTRVRGAIHQQPIEDLEKLKIPKNDIKTFMKLSLNTPNCH